MQKTHITMHGISDPRISYADFLGLFPVFLAGDRQIVFSNFETSFGVDHLPPAYRTRNATQLHEKRTVH